MSNIASGLFSCERTNAVSRRAAAAKSPTVRPLLQPQSLPRSRASTSEKSPPVSSAKPERVEAAVLLVARLVEVRDRAEDAADADRQVDEEDPSPAGVLGEHAADERADRDGGPIVAPQIPKAVPRSRPWNSWVRIASETENMIAPPTPWRPRARLRKRGEVAEPQSAEARVKMTTPEMKTRLRPSRSPSEPAFSVQLASRRA